MSGCQVSLVNGSIVIPGIITSVYYRNRMITGTFALAGTAPGIYNLTVTKPGRPEWYKSNSRSCLQEPILLLRVSPRFPDRTPQPCRITINGANFRTGITVTITNRTTNKTVAGTLTGTTVIKCTLPLTGLPIGICTTLPSGTRTVQT